MLNDTVVILTQCCMRGSWTLSVCKDWFPIVWLIFAVCMGCMLTPNNKMKKEEMTKRPMASLHTQQQIFCITIISCGLSSHCSLVLFLSLSNSVRSSLCIQAQDSLSTSVINTRGRLSWLPMSFPARVKYSRCSAADIDFYRSPAL